MGVTDDKGLRESLHEKERRNQLVEDLSFAGAVLR